MQKYATATFKVADLRHIHRALSARSEGILARLSRDPIIRDLMQREAARCRKLAESVAAILQGIG